MSENPQQRNRRKCVIPIFFGLPIGLIGLLTLWTYCKVKQDEKDHTLIAAIKAGDDKKILEALEAGASGEARDTGDPPTFREALLHLWKRIRHPDNDGPTKYPPALLLLYQHTAFQLTEHGELAFASGPHPILVRSLLDHGAVVNDRFSKDWEPSERLTLGGWTPLHFASVCSSPRTTRLLLEHGADPNLTDEDGDTPLLEASDVKTTELLLAYQANIEAENMDKQTALIRAAQRDNVGVVRTLLEHGAKVGMRDMEGKTALDYATDRPVEGGSDPDARKIEVLLRKFGAK